MPSTYHNETKVGEITYQLSATTDATDSLTLDLLGSRESGEVIADGRLRLPVEGGPAVGKLLSRILTAHTRLRGRPSRHANANQPWSESLDATLRTAWLTPPTSDAEADAATRIRAIAASMQRSPTAIRARLPRVGCDPDVPTRELSPTAAQLLGGKSGPTQGNT